MIGVHFKTTHEAHLEIIPSGDHHDHLNEYVSELVAEILSTFDERDVYEDKNANVTILTEVVLKGRDLPSITLAATLIKIAIDNTPDLEMHNNPNHSWSK